MREYLTYNLNYVEELELLEKCDPKDFTRIPSPNKSEHRKFIRTPQLNRLYEVLNNRLARIVFNSGVQNLKSRVKNVEVGYNDILERYVLSFQVDFFSYDRWSRRVCTIYAEHRGISFSVIWRFNKDAHSKTVQSVAMEIEDLLLQVDAVFYKKPKPTSTNVPQNELDKSPVL